MRYISFLLIILIGCATPKVIKPQYETVIDYISFLVDKSCNDINYPLTQEYIKDHKFVLKHKGRVFFEGDNASYDYLYEGFQRKCIFITPITRPNHLATPFNAKRDSVFVYDLDSEKLYHFNAKEFVIVAFREKPAALSTETILQIKKDGYAVPATYNGTNFYRKELYLLLCDLKTQDTVKLNPISGY